MSRKFRFFTAVSILLLVVSIGFNIAQALSDGTAEPGSDQDPLISKSYVDLSVGQLNQTIVNMQAQMEQLKKDNEGLVQKLNTQDTAIKTLQTELQAVKTQGANTPGKPSTPPAAPPATNTSSTLKGTVNTDMLNVRSQANTTSSIVAKIPRGEVVTIVTKGAEWHKIKTSKGVTGYALGRLITIK